MIGARSVIARVKELRSVSVADASAFQHRTPPVVRRQLVLVPRHEGQLRPAHLARILLLARGENRDRIRRQH
jgi:hypothetical protein